MLVRCVTSNWWSAMTLDKRYEVIEEQLGLYNLYKVINDSGVPYYYPIEFFEEISTIDPHIVKMIEIAEVQVKLSKLGFKYGKLLSGLGHYSKTNFSLYNMHKKYIRIRIHSELMQIFYEPPAKVDKRIERHQGDFYYCSPTWQEDLITKVKELIGNE